MNFYLIFFIILLIIALVLYIKYRKAVSVVKDNSRKFIKLKTLNKEFEFKKCKNKLEITHYVKTKKELVNISFDEIALKSFKDNVNNLTVNMELVLENENIFREYSSIHTSIKDITTKNEASITNMNFKLFKYLEKKIFKKYTLTPVVSTELILIIMFDGIDKDKSKKKNIYDYKELRRLYFEYDQFKNTSNSAVDEIV